MQIPSLAMAQVVTATGLLVLPAFSFHFGRGETRKLIRRASFVSAALGLLALGFAGLLAVFSHSTEKLLYAGKYAPYAELMALLALIPVLSGLAAGYSMALRAWQRPQFDLLSNIVAAPVGLLSAVLFMRWWGIRGAALSMVLGYATLTLTTFICFRWFTREDGRRDIAACPQV
jgi:O-antigen/teichoic acid export membrane protein